MKSRIATKAVGRVLAVSVLVGAFASPTFAATLVNINTADSATLQTLNGIGPSKAQAIIDYRTQNGLFTAIEDLKKVPGIGDSKFEAIKNEVSL